MMSVCLGCGEQITFGPRGCACTRANLRRQEEKATAEAGRKLAEALAPKLAMGEEDKMDGRELWAVTFHGQLKLHSADNGDPITDTFTVHVVTEQGWKAAVDAATKSVEAEWSVVVRKVEFLGDAPLTVA